MLLSILDERSLREVRGRLGLIEERGPTDLRGVLTRILRGARSKKREFVYWRFVSDFVSTIVLGRRVGDLEGDWLPEPGVIAADQEALSWLYGIAEGVFFEEENAWGYLLKEAPKVLDWARQEGISLSSLSWERAKEASDAWWLAREGDGTQVPGKVMILPWGDQLVELSEPRLVVREGELMGNCLSMTIYRRKAAHPGFLLLSLRGPSGKRIASIEFRWQGRDWLGVRWEEQSYRMLSEVGHNLWVPIQVRLKANVLPRPESSHYQRVRDALLALQPDVAYWGQEALAILRDGELEALYEGRLGMWLPGLLRGSKSLMKEGASAALWTRHYAAIGTPAAWMNDSVGLREGRRCRGICVAGEEGEALVLVLFEYRIVVPGEDWSARTLRVTVQVSVVEGRAVVVPKHERVDVDADDASIIPSAMEAVDALVRDRSGVREDGEWIEVSDFPSGLLLGTEMLNLLLQHLSQKKELRADQ